LERLYTLEEVARHLNVSLRTVLRFVAGRKLEVRRFGRTPRVSEEEFARFLREGTGPKPAEGVEPTLAQGKPTPELDRRAVFEFALRTATKKERGTK
jgi:excisionase family DNA binding protein